jgi:hypothetical protein
MGVTWRQFDHPRHSELFAHAQKLINALEDPLDFHWDEFTTLLHNAISRTTLRRLAEALKSVGSPADSNRELNKEPVLPIVSAEEAAEAFLLARSSLALVTGFLARLVFMAFLAAGHFVFGKLGAACSLDRDGYILR